MAGPVLTSTALVAPASGAGACMPNPALRAGLWGQYQCRRRNLLAFPYLQARLTARIGGGVETARRIGWESSTAADHAAGIAADDGRTRAPTTGAPDVPPSLTPLLPMAFP